MEDIWRLADRVTVFRDGHYIDTWDASGISQEKLIVAMVGREISQMYPKRAVKIGDEALRVENLTRVGFFRDVSFDVRAGEILALTGLVGAGRTEVCESIYGVHPADSGTIRLKGKTVSPRSPMDGPSKRASDTSRRTASCRDWFSNGKLAATSPCPR
jgi:rhamnose transport system ATP-binding protein